MTFVSSKAAFAESFLANSRSHRLWPIRLPRSVWIVRTAALGSWNMPPPRIRFAGNAADISWSGTKREVAS